MEGNPKFDCESLKGYEKIKVSYRSAIAFVKSLSTLQIYSQIKLEAVEVRNITLLALQIYSDCNGSEPLLMTRNHRLPNIVQPVEVSLFFI